MPRFLLRRAGTALLVMLGTTFVTFLLARVVPANPAVSYLGPKARPDEIARIEAQLGLDQPLPYQYGRYLWDLLRGDWGTSIGTKLPVTDEMFGRLPATLELLLIAMLLACLIGVALGVVAAARQNRFLDHLIRLLAIGGVSVPAFWLGLLLQVFVFGGLGLFELTGRLDPDLEFTDPLREITGFHLVDALLTGHLTALSDAAAHLVLPALTLAAYPIGVIARMTRASMLEILAADHIRAARAYGLRERIVHWRIALRGALPPTTTVAGLTLAYSLTGTFFVEVVFNWPGLGLFASTALLNMDYPVIMGITLFGAAGYVLVNLIVDLVQARLDPRVRLS
ncbi:ABC transporter permease [Nonomuraea turkmeniaca]|uniref:ABC transporter permease n=1 Tax=Nonomuraea turkmeniaca TaxID=103838 RepID=A0A5S4FHV7_9ACTN|nr:ABC transporter permease [Nonomuraea turkmeniaca]TMR19299.1 ABC transporter permease [Nonomuraea turkmeniaca]